MQTTSTKEQNPKKKKSSRFRKIFTGEFMVDEEFARIYPYLGFVILLIVLVILTQQSGEKKEKLIREKQIEYKEEINRLKQNNNFIPYEQNQELIKMIENQGFVKSDKHLYKIEIESEDY